MKIHAKIKGLHVLTDRELAYPKYLLEIMKLAVSGGASVLQLRDKNVPLEDMITLGKQLQKLTRNIIPLIVNDNIEAALALEATGIHVGQNDIPAKKVREIISPKMILGVSVSSVSQAIKAQKDGADYVGAGPIFPTSSKSDASSVLGLTGLEEIKMNINIPVIAIGGITLENAFKVAELADGLAVISAVLKADNPQKTVMDFIRIIKNTGDKK